MDITQTKTIIININGTNYSFDTPHDVEDLINQLTNEQDQLALWPRNWKRWKRWNSYARAKGVGGVRKASRSK